MACQDFRQGKELTGQAAPGAMQAGKILFSTREKARQWPAEYPGRFLPKSLPDLKSCL
jgi:hypothetical protein